MQRGIVCKQCKKFYLKPGEGLRTQLQFSNAAVAGRAVGWRPLIVNYTSDPSVFHVVLQ